MFDGFAPLRLCLFAEPVHVYRGARVRLEAVLANEDALAPGEYPVRLQVVGPQNQRIFEKTVTVTIAEGAAVRRAGLRRRRCRRRPVGQVPVPGHVRARRRGDRRRDGVLRDRSGGDAGGQNRGRAGATTPSWRSGSAEHGIRSRPFAGGRTGAARGDSRLQAAARRSRTCGGASQRGATAVFLSPDVFTKGDQPLGWLPLANKGTATPIRGWLYLKDEWAKRHPIFDGLPGGGLMDYTFYREIIPDLVLVGQDPPAEAVAGAIKASQDYSSGLMLAVYELGRRPLRPEHAADPREPRHPSGRRAAAAQPAALRGQPIQVDILAPRRRRHTIKHFPIPRRSPSLRELTQVKDLCPSAKDLRSFVAVYFTTIGRVSSRRRSRRASFKPRRCSSTPCVSSGSVTQRKVICRSTPPTGERARSVTSPLLIFAKSSSKVRGASPSPALRIQPANVFQST